MKAKLLLTVLTLAASHGTAFAACYGEHAKDEIVMSCTEGTTYDPETKTCISTTS